MGARLAVITERDIYHNQTAILYWLKAQGHPVEFMRDYDGAPNPMTLRVRAKVPKHATENVANLRKQAEGKPCPYCETPMTLHGRTKVTRDHVTPKSRGGKLTEDNRLMVCLDCNGDKGGRSLEEWVVRLTRRGDRRLLIILALIKSRTG